MEKVTSIREGVEKLLKLRGREVPEFTFENRQEGGFTPTLLWEGKRIPLFTTRYDPRIRLIAGYGNKTEENKDPYATSPSTGNSVAGFVALAAVAGLVVIASKKRA